MSYAICTVAAAPVRKEPSHRSEMTNQLLFGETFEVLEEKEEWRFVRSLYDGYEGWLTDHLIQLCEASLALPKPAYVATALANTVQQGTSSFEIPMGAHLTGFNESSGSLWNPQLSFKGRYRKTANIANTQMLVRSAYTWVNVPYLWGGKTLMGVDCSGFVQTLFKVMGIALLRDAWQQEEGGKAVASLEEGREGDLLFFKNENGRVTHVGLLLEGNKVIHAAGKVRIDPVDMEGIIHNESGKRTHRHLTMRRYL